MKRLFSLKDGNLRFEFAFDLSKANIYSQYQNVATKLKKELAGYYVKGPITPFGIKAVCGASAFGAFIAAYLEGKAATNRGDAEWRRRSSIKEAGCFGAIFGGIAGAFWPLWSLVVVAYPIYKIADYTTRPPKKTNKD